MIKKFLLICFFLTAFQTAQATETDFMLQYIDESSVSSPAVHIDYDYQNTDTVLIDLRIKEKISTRDKTLYEGMPVVFEVYKTAFCKNKPVAKKGDIIKGKVKYVIPSGLNGMPYCLIVGDFNFPNLDSNKISYEYKKEGFNRTYFVLPLKWALTFLPPTGSLTNFIKGGHAKITPKTKITLTYHPNWK